MRRLVLYVLGREHLDQLVDLYLVRIGRVRSALHERRRLRCDYIEAVDQVPDGFLILVALLPDLIHLAHEDAAPKLAVEIVLHASNRIYVCAQAAQEIVDHGFDQGFDR